MTLKERAQRLTDETRCFPDDRAAFIKAHLEAVVREAAEIAAWIPVVEYSHKGRADEVARAILAHFGLTDTETRT